MLKCVVCKSDHIQALNDVKSPFEPVDYKLYECLDCKSRFFVVDRKEEELASVYDDDAEITSDIYDVSFRRSPYWQHQVNILNSLSVKPIRSVLDVGCRTGDFLMHWPEDTAKYGVELSRKWASIAEKRGLNIKQDFLENVDYTKTFDIVTCYAVIEHLRDPLSFIGDMPRLVSDDGIVVIMIPTYQCALQKIVSKVGKRWHMYCPPQHINFLSRKKLDSVMKSYGFSLAARRYSSGGMFNPLRNVPLVNKVFGRFVFIADYYSPMQYLKIFDHMFSYYRKAK